VVVLAANRLGVAAIFANTKDIDGRVMKTTIGELLQAEFTNISENLHEDDDILDHDAKKPQNSLKLTRGPVRTNNIPALVHHNNACCQQ